MGLTANQCVPLGIQFDSDALRFLFLSMDSIKEIINNAKSITEVAYKVFGSKSGSSWTKAKLLCEEHNKTFNKKVKLTNCLLCGKKLSNYQEKFCSLSCASKFNNKLRVISSSDNETKVVIGELSKDKDVNYCLNCNIELKRKNNKFCSSKCSSEYRNNELIRKWLETGIIDNKNNLPYTIRKFLYEKAQYKCEICGFEGYNRKTGNTILQIHHIDGNNANNKIENLQVICPNCHAMTENYMALNKGKGRIGRYNS